MEKIENMFVRCNWITLVLIQLVMTRCIFGNEICLFQCEENGECLHESSRCNGIQDCLHGSDEAYVHCKDLNILGKSNIFTCAHGPELQENQKCNKKADCVDKSDESPIFCDENFDTDTIIDPDNNCREYVHTFTKCLLKF